MAIKIEITRHHRLVVLPRPATAGSAGYDLQAAIDEPRTIEPGETTAFSTGISIHIRDAGIAAVILPRSGLGIKHGIVLSNTVGLIDSDYTGVIQVALRNASQTAYTLKPLERVAQMVLIPVIHASWCVVDGHEKTDRNIGGFGHTGK